MELTETEQLVLRAMQRVHTECGSQKSVVILRYALLEIGRWNENRTRIVQRRERRASGRQLQRTLPNRSNHALCGWQG